MINLNTMHMLGIEVTLHLYSVHSLKEKRRILRSILDHSHHRYKVTNAEINYLDNLSRAGLGFGLVTNNLQTAEKILQKVINYLDQQVEVEIVEINWIEI